MLLCWTPHENKFIDFKNSLLHVLLYVTKRYIFAFILIHGIHAQEYKQDISV